MRVLIIVLQVLLFITAKSQKLGGSKWQIVSIDDLDSGISKNIAGTVKATFNFDSDSSYSGKFCNAFSGRYKYNGEQAIKLGIATSSKMLCMGIDKYEKELFGLLPLANKYRVENENMFIFTTAHKRITLKRAMQ